MPAQTETPGTRHSASRTQDLFLVFMFIVILIVFHIFLLQLSSKELNVDIQQRIVYHKEDTIIHLRSETREKLLDRKRNQNTFWDLPYAAVSTPYHLKYRPVKSWPVGLDSSARWKYFLKECSDRNVTEDELVNCAYDSEMFRRRLLVKKTCLENKTYKDEIDAYKIFAMVTRRLVWCPVYKAASTNWMKNIPRLSHYTAEQVARLNNKKKNRQANTLARAIVPYIPAQHLLKFLHSDPKPVVFIIVRNPFDRLLSAYRDKLERYNKYYYKKYGQQIVTDFRAEGIERFGTTFYDKNGQNGSPVTVVGRKGNEPTFWEFVTALLKTGIVDEHWKPVLNLCSMCAQGLDFDFVIKFEHLAEEEHYPPW